MQENVQVIVLGQYYNNNKNILKRIGGLSKECSISIANALEILQSCTKPSICFPMNIQRVTGLYHRPVRAHLKEDDFLILNPGGRQKMRKNISSD